MANLTQPFLPPSASDGSCNMTLLYSLLGAAGIAATFYLRTASHYPKGAPTSPRTSGSGFEDGDSRSIAAYFTSKDRDGVIVFGSQTGTAEGYARRLQDLFKTLPLLKSSKGMKKFAGFVVATYGDGEPTDNAAEFHKLLSDDSQEFSGLIPRSENPLSGLNYIAFGLGNKTYKKYNFMVRHVKEKLDSLGATSIGEAGEGDDGAGTMDEDFLQWKDSTLDAMTVATGLKKSEKEWTPSYIVEQQSEINRLDPQVNLGDEVFSKQRDHKRTSAVANVSTSRQLYNSNSIPRRECIYMELDLSSTGLSYTTGDHVGMSPFNPEDEVDRLLRILNLTRHKDTVILVSQADVNASVLDTQQTTYSTLLRHLLGICGSVSRESMRIMLQFAPSQHAKELLERFIKDKDYFHSFVMLRCLSLGQLLEIANKGEPWTSLPFTVLLNVVPVLQPRYYSISSSSAKYLQKLHITAAVKRDSFVDDGRDFYSVASNYIRTLAKETGTVLLAEDKKDLMFELTTPRMQRSQPSCRIHIRHSSFRLPSNPTTPIIMVGPGTGVAPFRGFIQERVKMAMDGERIEKSLLYFGCRTRDENYLYADEWITAKQQLRDDFEMRTAFSREGSDKVYVQNQLLEDASAVFDMLDTQKAWFYVCGNAKNMAKDVRDVMVSIISTTGNLSKAEAEQYIHDLQSGGRFHEDIW